MIKEYLISTFKLIAALVMVVGFGMLFRLGQRTMDTILGWNV